SSVARLSRSRWESARASRMNCQSAEVKRYQQPGRGNLIINVGLEFHEPLQAWAMPRKEHPVGCNPPPFCSTRFYSGIKFFLPARFLSPALVGSFACLGIIRP